jgi:hypothetical protein
MPMPMQASRPYHLGSVRDQVSPREWEARVQLAAAYRLTEMFGMTEMVANHISCRVPDEEDRVNGKRVRAANQMVGVSPWEALLRKLDRMDPTYKD